MSLIIDSTGRTIDSSAIAKGDLIRAKYYKWDKAQNGIVAKVTDSEIRVLYIPDIGNVTNYFPIKADEIDAGLWTIAWSGDMATITTEGEDENA